MKHTITQALQPEAARGTLQSYTIGFVLSVIMTVFAYFLVVDHSLNATAITAAILILAVAQMGVQLVFFLHLGQESKPRWNLIVLLFALLVVTIIVLGSVWIMNNLNTHMAPPSDVNTYIIQDQGITK